jgi:hypothetical protein
MSIGTKKLIFKNKKALEARSRPIRLRSEPAAVTTVVGSWRRPTRRSWWCGSRHKLVVEANVAPNPHRHRWKHVVVNRGRAFWTGRPREAASCWSRLPQRRQAGRGRHHPHRCRAESSSWLPCSTMWPMQRCSSRRRSHVCCCRGSRGRSSRIVLLPLLWRCPLLQPETVAVDVAYCCSNLTWSEKKR